MVFSREWEDYDKDYPFWNGLNYSENNGNPYIEWQTILFDDDGHDEGFYYDKKHDYGLGVYLSIGNEGEVFIGYLACDDGGYSRGLYVDGNKHGETYSPGSGYGGKWEFRYDEGKLNGHFCTWIKPRWYIPFKYRNTNIKIRLTGTWWKWTKSYGSHKVDVNKTVEASYTYKVRTIAWNDTYSVAPDGTVTIPYSFGGTACNTDGQTHICTSIGGSYSGKIGYKYPTSNYSANYYTFKLSDIGKNMRSSSFTIEPYHEFTHYNDKDNSNGIKYYTAWPGSKTFKPLPIATNFKGAFHQKEKKVTLTWKADNTN